METLYYSKMKSPIGPLWIAVSNKGVVLVDWGSRQFPPEGSKESATWVLSEEKTAAARKQLTEYFDGNRTEFSVPLDIRNGTEFQRKCWEILVNIPYGETRSYQEVARLAGRPLACRAVGQANHANPIPILIPCHRVINADGGLAGFGGGVHVKEQLLAMEGALPCSEPLFKDLGKMKSAKSGA